MSTFLYEARRAAKGQARAHRYHLLPVLRPELAMIYGGDPIKFVDAGDLIDRNAWAKRFVVSAPVAPGGATARTPGRVTSAHGRRRASTARALRPGLACALRRGEGRVDHGDRR